MRVALVLSLVCIACGGGHRGEPPRPGEPVEGAPPAPAEPASPAAEDLAPRARSLAAACHAEEDLAPAAYASGGCAAAPADLGAPIAVRIPRYLTGCDDDVKVDGRGTIASYATRGLGGGGYWAGDLALVRPDGAVAVTPFQTWYRASAAGSAGLLTFQDPWDVALFVDGSEPAATSRIEWPMQLGPWWFHPATYLGWMGAAGDGGGGLVVALAGGGADGDLELWAARIGADARVATPPFHVATVPAPEPGYLADRSAVAARRAFGTVVLGIDGAGRMLVLWDGGAACGDGTIAGRWFRPDGTPLGPIFRAASDVEPWDPVYQGRRNSRIVRLLDGSLALQHHDGSWLRRFAGGIPAGGAVPAWLAARAGESLAPTPGGAVLAAIRPSALRPDRRPVIALVSATGEVCAEHVLPEQPAPTGWAPDVVVVGVDGTIVESAGAECDPAFPTFCPEHLLCAYRAWPAALR